MSQFKRFLVTSIVVALTSPAIYANESRKELVMTQVEQAANTSTRPSKEAIRPFRVTIPEKEITELRRRILATRWPEKETVADQSQGVPLATMQELARYWATDYDWRKAEAKLNAFPQFITEIDGLAGRTRQDRRRSV